MENHIKENDTATKSKTVIDTSISERFSEGNDKEYLSSSMPIINVSENHLLDCENESTNKNLVDDQTDVRSRIDEDAPNEKSIATRLINVKSSSNISSMENDYLMNDDELLAADSSDDPVVAMNDENKLLEDNDSDEGTKNKCIETQDHSSVNDASFAPKQNGNLDHEKLSMAAEETNAKTAVIDENILQINEPEKNINTTFDNSENQFSTNEISTPSDEVMEVEENLEPLYVPEKTCSGEVMDILDSDNRGKEGDKYPGRKEDEPNKSESLITFHAAGNNQRSNSPLNDEVSSENNSVDSISKNIDDSVELESDLNNDCESKNEENNKDFENENQLTNTEVLHVDETENDHEDIVDGNEKDPFAQDVESSNLHVETEEKNNTKNVESHAEAETLSCESAENALESAIGVEVPSEDSDISEEVALKTSETSAADVNKTTNDVACSEKEEEEGNCIIPDTNDNAQKEVKVVNKQVRKFDITPVRLEKLMDPSKLAAVKLESSLSTLASGRPQRQAAKKAETQIKEIVAQTDVEPEEPDQNAVCCRCSRLRMCKYISSSGTFACVDNCYQFLIERRAPAPVRILSAIKGFTTIQPKLSSKILDAEHFSRKCAFCGLNNIVEEKSVSWEAMDFCNEECINRYQVQHGSLCAYCNNNVQHISMGKYAVRFGLDARQFCSGGCLEEFKKGLKSCSYCQLDITNSSCSVCVPVGEKQATMKDFCSQSCAEKYEIMSSGSSPAPIHDSCTVCANKKLVEIQVICDSETHLLCSDACFRAFKFANNITETNQCGICKKFYQQNNPDSYLVYHEESCHHFCSKICMNLFILFKRKIVPCSWCKVKKYNFDMIRKSVSGGGCIMMCSLNCLTLYQVSMNASSTRKIKCDLCSNVAHAQYHLTMSDATIRNFCSYNCVMLFQTQYNKTPLTLHEQNKSNLMSVSVPVVNAVSSKPTVTIANGLLSSASATIKIGSPLTVAANSATNLPTVISTSTGVQIQKQTKYVQHIVMKPEPKELANKCTQCRPSVSTKGVSCRPALNSKECQTEERLNHPPVLPIPVPIYVPVPMHMYTTPFPVPVPFALPIPVPIFVPTSHKTFKGVMSQIKEIVEKTPSNPYEADLLLMAKMVAGEDKTDADEVTKNDSGDDDDTHFTEAAADLSDGETFPETDNSVSNNFNDEMLQTVLKMATEQLNKTTNVDLETELTSNTITPQTQVEENGTQADVPETPIEKPRQRKRTQRTSTEAPSRKRTRSQQAAAAAEAENHPPPVVTPKTNEVTASRLNESERPDASMCLKYTFGVRAWKQWVILKNEQIGQTASSANKKAKLFNTNILKLTTDELNFLLCQFVKEVRKPNGMEYAPDTIYYLCLSIQQYLFENGRIDNIFSDSFYEPFTNALDEVARKFTDINDTTQYIVTRVEEEHLWESKQLGAHSPHVLLATLMFFNTKYFNLATLEEHMQLSFSHIMKHWKRNPNMPVGKPGSPAPNRNVVLRFYPPQAALDAPNSRKKKVYEQHENEVNPLRCPVKLYEFYLSKCPESVKQRNDVFYLQPERSCVPDSPVWYSTMPLQKELLMKMLHRIRMVKEVNISLLAS